MTGAKRRELAEQIDRATREMHLRLKWCERCSLWHPLDMFSRRASYCRTCESVRVREANRRRKTLMNFRDVVARIVVAACALEDGDPSLAHQILLDLELDLERVIQDEELAA